jgi:hypothetical protein
VQGIDDLREDFSNRYATLSKKADNDLHGLRNKAKKLIENSNKRILLIEEEGGKFSEVIDKESPVEDKYSQRIYEVVMETTGKIEIPEEVTFRKLNQFVKTSRDALSAQDETLIKYVKLLKKKKFKPRVKSLSRAFGKLNGELIRLESFISSDYGPNSQLENILDTLDEISRLLDQYEQKFEDISSKKDEVDQLQEKIDGTLSQIKLIEAHPDRLEYELIYGKYRDAQREFDTEITNIKKALKKLMNKMTKGKTTSDTTLIREFITDPFICLINQGSLGSINNLLSVVNESMNKAELSLKKDKREAAQEDINKFQSGKLDELWQQAKQINKELNAIKIVIENHKFDKQLEDLDKQHAMGTRDRNRLIEREQRDLGKIIKELDKNFLELIEQGKTQNIEFNKEIELPSLPEWATLI